MPSELPETPARVIYDLDRAARLLPGDPEDAKVLVADSARAADIYGTELAIYHFSERDAPPPVAPRHALFDRGTRVLVDDILNGRGDADVAAKMLMKRRGAEFHRVELTRWARAVGLLAPETAGEPVASAAGAVVRIQASPPSASNTEATWNSSTGRQVRRNILDPVIERAQASCTDASDAAEVWAALVKLAGEKVAPLFGSTEQGLQYKKPNDDVAYFKLSNLRDRLRRRASAR